MESPCLYYPILAMPSAPTTPARLSRGHGVLSVLYLTPARIEKSNPMHNQPRPNTLILILVAASASCAFAASADQDVARWEQQARNVTIIRDNWGIAHVYGKTDADTVFGAM